MLLQQKITCLHIFDKERDPYFIPYFHFPSATFGNSGFRWGYD
jgi:hypothetical protein